MPITRVGRHILSTDNALDGVANRHEGERVFDAAAACGSGGTEGDAWLCSFGVFPWLSGMHSLPFQPLRLEYHDSSIADHTESSEHGLQQIPNVAATS